MYNLRLDKSHNKQEGVTLIALVITIIVLIILAGVSISALTGENGVLNQAKMAKEKNIEGKEIDEIHLSYNACVASNLGDGVTREGLQKELDDLVGNDLTNVSGNGSFKVKFKTTGNVYSIKGKDVEKYVPADYTDIYVSLYNDGTLIFSNNENDFDSNKVVKSYGNIIDLEMYLYQTPWYNDSKKITKVDIINKIVPKKMEYLFSDLVNVTEFINLSNINTERVESLEGLFYSCGSITSLDLSSWDVGNVKNAESFICFSKNLLVIDFTGWDTSSFISLNYMFDSGYPTAKLNLKKIIGFENIDTSNVTEMNNVFGNCIDLEFDASNWNTDKVIYTDRFIYNNSNIPTKIVEPIWTNEYFTNIFVSLYNDGTLVFSNNENDFDSSKVIKTYGNIKNSNLCINEYNPELEPWLPDYKDVKKVLILNEIRPFSLAYFFNGFENATDFINLNNIKTEDSYLDYSYTFTNCKSVKNIDISSWNLGEVSYDNDYNRIYMFYNCQQLEKLNIGDVYCDDASFMFYNCSKLNLDCSKWKLNEYAIGDGFNEGAPGVISPKFPKFE